MSNTGTPSILDQISAYREQLGDVYVFPVSGLQIHIRPVSVRVLLSGGIVPEGYDPMRMVLVASGKAPDVTEEDVAALLEVQVGIIKEAVRRGWPEQYDAFVEHMLPMLGDTDITALWQHLISANSENEARFPPADDTQAN